MNLILTWWISLEREISIQSAKFIQKYLGEKTDMLYLPEDLDKLLEMKDKIDFAIPVFHWKYGEDGCIFAFLKILGIKTAFSDFDVHALCLDKYKTGILLREVWLKVPNEILVKKWDKLDEQKINEDIKFPCILKPNNGWSSFHTYKIESFPELQEKLDFVFSQIDEDMLIWEYILWDEYSVSLVGREVLPIMKVEKQDKTKIFDYESKYENADFMKETWPEIEEKEFESFKEIAIKIYDFLGIKWFCRVDFIKREDEIFFLEINTIPGMTEGSILPKSWKKTGKSFEELVRKVMGV